MLSSKAYRRSLTPKLIRRRAGQRSPAIARRSAIAERYGVPSRIIVGIWGMESNFGHFSGVRPTVAALATLAYDPRRSTFFRGELFKALEILNRGDIEFASMRGSWAGAMGQPQFMPSSYLQYAEDFDGDGRRDIWSTPADVFASIANYLRGHGWAADGNWGREVRVTPEAARRIARDVAPRSGSCQATRNERQPPLSSGLSFASSFLWQALPKSDAGVAGVRQHAPLSRGLELRRHPRETAPIPTRLWVAWRRCIRQAGGGV